MFRPWWIPSCDTDHFWFTGLKIREDTSRIYFARNVQHAVLVLLTQWRSPGAVTISMASLGKDLVRAAFGFTAPCVVRSLCGMQPVQQGVPLIAQQLQGPTVTVIVLRIDDVDRLRNAEAVLAGERLRDWWQIWDQTFELSLRHVPVVGLPGGLRELILENFNGFLENVFWPRGLHELSLGTLLNQFLEKVSLPTSLKYLYLGCQFNQALDKSLPAGLVELEISYASAFNQSLDTMTWPVGLQRLTFDNLFNQNLDNARLPNALECLTFSKCFNQILDNVKLPGGLRALTFGYGFQESLRRVTWPSGLQLVNLQDPDAKVLLVELPSSLRWLAVGHGFDLLHKVTLTSSLQYVNTGASVILQGLPAGLRHLEFGSVFNQSLGNVIPPSGLMQPAFGTLFNRAVRSHQLPSGLQQLRFGDDFNQSLDTMVFLGGLRILRFAYGFK